MKKKYIALTLEQRVEYILVRVFVVGVTILLIIF